MAGLKFWRDRPTFITGASGFLGGWLIKRLYPLGADIVCLMRDWIPQSELIRSNLVDRVKVVRGDICDQALLERILGEYEISVVFHLAAQTIVGVANRNPVSTFDSDIRGTWSLLEACRRSPKVEGMVVASSDKGYFSQNKLPYRETGQLKGEHPYEVSKSCVDLIAQTYGKAYQLPVAITRCGNIYGGGDLNWNRIVPGTIRSILHGQSPIIRSDGKYVRDYFYAEDATLAYVMLAERIVQKKSLFGEAFNFSNGKPLTVLEIVGRISELMGSKLEPVILDEASDEVREQYLDASKAREMLGWTPAYDIGEGLKRTIEWYKEYISG